MKTIAAILLVSCFGVGQDKMAISAAEAACGPHDVNFEVKVDASRHPTPMPENGKALIYVVQEDSITSRFGVDGKWVGANHGRTYFFIQIDPGEHHLCATAQGMGPASRHPRVALRQLIAEAGMTYYFVPHVAGESVYAIDAKFDLNQVDLDQGKALIARAKFGTSRPKQ